MEYMSSSPEAVKALAKAWIEKHGSVHAYEMALDQCNLSTNRIARMFWGDVRDEIYNRRID